MTFEPPKGYTNVGISLIRQMNQKAKSSSINLGLGQLPYRPCKDAVYSMEKALTDGKITYSPNAGALDVREAISDRHLVRTDKRVSANDIIITVGVQQALYNTISVFANGDARILIPEIGFPVYESIPQLVGGIDVSSYKLHLDLTPHIVDIEDKLADDTRQTLIVVNSPSNPLGSVMSEDDTRKLGSLLDKYPHAYVLSDEVYSELYFGPDRPFSVASVSDKVIVADGISKMGAATGIRVGWTIAPENITKEMLKLQQNNIGCPPTPNQYFAVPIIDGSAEILIEQYRDNLRKNHALVQSALDSTNLLSAIPSQGSFYSFVDVSQIGDSISVANTLLDEEDVLVIPGKAFGDSGDSHIRVSFATSEDKLEKGLERLVRFAQRRA